MLACASVCECWKGLFLRLCVRVCVYVCGCAWVCVCPCAHVRMLVRWSACTGALAACAVAGVGGSSAALAVACATSPIAAVRRVPLCAAGRLGLRCNGILGLPAGPAPRPMPSAMPPAVEPAIAAALRSPQAAHTRLTRMPRLLQRVGVCARAFACRRCCRSRRWPAGKAPRSPATQIEWRHELREAVRGAWGYSKYSRICECLACSVPILCESSVNSPSALNCTMSPSCSAPCSLQTPPVLPAVCENAKHSPRRSHAAAQSGSVSTAAPCTTGVPDLPTHDLVPRVPLGAGGVPFEAATPARTACVPKWAVSVAPPPMHESLPTREYA